MKAKREELIKNGKYNLKAIMKRAWAYVKNPFNTQYRGDFKGALKAAWVDAKLAMDACKASSAEVNPVMKQGNVMKSAFIAGHREYRSYDSSWR